MMSRKIALLLFALLVLLSVSVAAAQSDSLAPYSIGNPQLVDVYISPNGDDNNPGTLDAPMRTLAAAWQAIPMGVPLDTGYHLWLMPGAYREDALPNYWEARYGSADHPIIIESTDGAGSVSLASVNLYDVRYVYFINLTFNTPADSFHCELCDHLLLRGNTVIAPAANTYASQETVKVNQSQYVYLEANDISGAWDNAVDFVAVQYGHILNNRIHGAGDWCMYVKGGSAYFRVEGNAFYDCGTGGFTMGQGTGFQFMVEPWIQYEAYDIKFVNNIIYRTAGAGVGVQGGYNILIAHNTIVQVGERSHVIEVVFGGRSCDGQAGEPGREKCDQYMAAGGWGGNLVGDGNNFARIPNRNVYILNNIIYNPAPYRSAYQHFVVFPPFSEAASQGTAPVPAVSDDNLIIRGNIIWNGDSSMPLGVGDDPDFPSGCSSQSLTCNPTQLLAENVINLLEPQLTNIAAGDFRPLSGGNVFTVPPAALPDFTWDVPVPAGVTSNALQEATFVGAYDPLQFNADAVAVAVVPTAAPVVQPTAQPVQPVQPTQQQMVVSTGKIPAGAVALITLGDSLTEGDGDDAGLGGYPGRLLTFLQGVRPGSVLLNFGHSGWNSDALIFGDQGLPSELVSALDAITQAKSSGLAPVVLVWIGSNDLFYLYEYNNPDAAAEEADAQHYAQNLDMIVSQLQGAGATVFLALLDDQSHRPVTQAGQAFTGISPTEVQLMSAQVLRYNQRILETAARYDTGIVDVYSTTIFTDPNTLADDGNHPNGRGYDAVTMLWFNALLAVL